MLYNANNYEVRIKSIKRLIESMNDEMINIEDYLSTNNLDGDIESKILNYDYRSGELLSLIDKVKKIFSEYKLEAMFFDYELKKHAHFNNHVEMLVSNEYEQVINHFNLTNERVKDVIIDFLSLVNEVYNFMKKDLRTDFEKDNFISNLKKVGTYHERHYNNLDGFVHRFLV